MNTEILKNISYGVYVISTNDETKSTGCIANSVIQVTQDTIAISINHNNYTNECIKKSKKFAISILDENIEDNIIPTFGFQSGREINKFENIEKVNFDNLDVIKNSIGYLTCTLIDSLETSTHTIFLGKIINGDILNNNKNPMTYAYYHKVKKGLSPKNAPTYIEPKNETGYKCSICGYLYVGDITKENNDFVCPICKQNKNVIIKV